MTFRVSLSAEKALPARVRKSIENNRSVLA